MLKQKWGMLTSLFSNKPSVSFLPIINYLEKVQIHLKKSVLAL